MPTAARTAQAVQTGAGSARAAVQASLDRIAATDPRVNAFTAVLAERALKRADAVDASPRRARMRLAGVPFAVKNLFDVAGLATLAGSKIERDAPPAARDAVLVRRLEAEGAVLVGALNMDEYAYGFTTENSHAGPCRNPHDLQRVAGGSSGGSAAAVAAGQVPLTLGSDTNGSIRVPASLCGTYGLKPTFGRLPRTGSYPFVASLDHLGPFARSVADLALAYDLLQGPDVHDPACAQRDIEPTLAQLGRGAGGLRVAVLGGWFREQAQPEALAAVDNVAQALGTTRLVELPEVERARAAAFLITCGEGGALHLDDLRRRAHDFDPATRDRFLANALVPAAWVMRAQRVRHWFARRVARAFETVDVLIASATPCTAPPIGSAWLELAGRRLPMRPSLGLLTQPVSCIGLPVATVPLWGLNPAAPHLPIGVQLIAAPWREDLCLRVAAALEAQGVCSAPVATPL
ncbi:MAG: AtzE family amidohydrolase [Burkholderiales bacterium]|nr:AtzE family amidohydrolase [Burkholderiales bacterium]